MADAIVSWRASEFVDVLGVSPSTLKRWERLGKVVPGRYPSGMKYYTIEHLCAALGLSMEAMGVEQRLFVSSELRRLLGSGAGPAEAFSLAKLAWERRDVSDK